MFWPFNRKGRFSKNIEIKAPAVVEPPKPGYKLVEAEQKVEIFVYKITVEMKNGKKYTCQTKTEAQPNFRTICLVNGYGSHYRNPDVIPAKIRGVSIIHNNGNNWHNDGRLVSFTDSNGDSVTVHFEDVDSIINHKPELIETKTFTVDELHLIEDVKEIENDL